MILLIQNGSRYSVNLYPSIVEVLSCYLERYNEDMLKMASKMIDEAELHMFRRKHDPTYGLCITKYRRADRTLGFDQLSNL